ncbi:DgyrCDS12184 [Dimorphilus gyrociliatus]|uniref:Alpha-1,3-glucosyltransferase n=1 Tax=Dimorphilus gyrociliatus TaxID=2664684 RepID=A0A7I8W5Q6_9ANNE|nr:DgyrCDS12184 [Dimorphilus gyrociliatus]
MKKAVDDSKFYSIVVFLFALLVRWLTSLGPFSGKGKSPMYGDYEAQRHWMEITYNLPIKSWYYNTTDNDLLYWGLDYPPLTAYHSLIMGFIANKINPEFVALHKSRGIESPTHKLFMRYTVIIGDLLIYIPAVFIYFLGNKSIQSKGKISCCLLALLYPGLTLIDHGHFQFLQLLKVSFVTLIAFLLCWLPFLRDFQDALQVLHRLFPFARGIFEDKVANFWCSLSIVIKFRSLMTQDTQILMCLVTTIILLLPSGLHLLLKPTMRNFKLALVNSSLIFFLFSFQVHEKSILIAAL